MIANRAFQASETPEVSAMASMTPMKNMRQYPDTFSQGRETQDGASLLSHIAAEDDYDNLFEYSSLFLETPKRHNGLGGGVMHEKELATSQYSIGDIVNKYQRMKMATKTQRSFSAVQQPVVTQDVPEQTYRSKAKRQVDLEKLKILSRTQIQKYNAHTEAEMKLCQSMQRAHDALFRLADVADDSYESANGLLRTRMYQPAKDRVTHKSTKISPTPSPEKRKRTLRRYRSLMKSLTR